MVKAKLSQIGTFRLGLQKQKQTVTGVQYQIARLAQHRA